MSLTTPSFFGILIQSFGFSSTDTLLLGMANSWLAIWIIVFMFLGDYLRNRCAMSIFPLLVSTAGTAMTWAIPQQYRSRASWATTWCSRTRSRTLSSSRST
jgi:hypothetical protein